MRATARTGSKDGRSDPVARCGSAIAQRIKGTLGITGLSRPRVHIDGAVWHLDVGLSHPGAGEGPKGPAVRRLKWYMSWVQNVRFRSINYSKKRTITSEDVEWYLKSHGYLAPVETDPLGRESPAETGG